MPHAIALLLMTLGCAPAQFTGPSGSFFVWVCPPVIEAPPAAPEIEERES